MQTTNKANNKNTSKLSNIIITGTIVHDDDTHVLTSESTVTATLLYHLFANDIVSCSNVTVTHNNSVTQINDNDEETCYSVISKLFEQYYVPTN